MSLPDSDDAAQGVLKRKKIRRSARSALISYSIHFEVVLDSGIFGCADRTRANEGQSSYWALISLDVFVTVQ